MSEFHIYCAHRELRITEASWRAVAVSGAALLRVEAPDLVPKVFQIFANTPEVPTFCLLCDDATSLYAELEAHLTPITACGGVVSNAQGQLLLIRRHGLCDLPKGKLEPDEGLAQAAIREVEEETGCMQLELIGPLCETLHCYQLDTRWMLKTTHWFAMRTPHADSLLPQRAEGITEAFWASPHEALQLAQETYPTIRRVLECYLEMLG